MYNVSAKLSKITYSTKLYIFDKYLLLKCWEAHLQ